ncbi:MAG: PKD domain-containing protein [Bacteroidales bacterium]
MKHLFLFTTAILVSLLSYSQITSTFDIDTENWHSEGDGDYFWESGVGNPGGCFRVNDDATGDMNRAYAPVKFLGDWSAATTNDSVSADIFLHDAGGGYVSPNFVFRIVGPGGSAKAIYDPIPTPPDDNWITYSVHFNESNWYIESGTWTAILEHVTSFIVTMEYISGDEWNRIDNVILSFSPISIPLAPVICSDFESGLLEGWSFIGTGGYSIQSTGGNPGKYVRLTDGTGVSLAVPSSEYHGNWSLLDGHNAEIHVDYLLTNVTGPINLPDFFMKISGPGGVATYPFISSMELAFDHWHSYGIPIEQASWTIESGDWASLINYISEIQLAAEFINGGEIVGIDNFCISNLPPAAGFTSDKSFIFQGESVQFQDQSTSGPQTWLWDFGDSETSTEVNPLHQYMLPGTYTVTLITTNHFGNSTETKTDYIEVYPDDQCLKFEDSFEDNTISPYWWLKNGTWSEASGNIRQTSNYYQSSILDGCFAIIGSPNWENYIFSCELMSTDNDHIGLVFDWQDEQNMYMFTWNLQGNYRQLIKWVNGVQTLLASDAVGYVQNQWYQIDIYSISGQLALAIDGVKVFNVDDNTFTTGKAGLFCSGNQSSYWDYYKVECRGSDVYLKAFLEGPYNGMDMNTGLNNQLLIPLSNPYTSPPWNHLNTEGISAPPEATVVDWVLVEFRDAPSAELAVPGTRIGTYAAFLLQNGDIVNPYNYGPIYLNYEINDNLFAVVYHRNHLSIMSAGPLIESDGNYTYDFTIGANQAYGTGAQKDIGNGKYGMYAGDFNADGAINSADKSSIWFDDAGKFGYHQSDSNLDGEADNLDKNDVWLNNNGISSQVPD